VIALLDRGIEGVHVDVRDDSHDRTCESYDERPWTGTPPGASIPARSIPSGEVTYDLRIWQGWLGGPGELVYSRNALVDPWHTIEILLDPSTLYFWTIRERRVANGQTRVSDWAVLKMDPSGLDDRRLARIPHPGYYRFKTPKQ